MSPNSPKQEGLSVREALRIIGRSIRVVAGKADRIAGEHSLHSLGISSERDLDALRRQIKAELKQEGYELRKMSLDGLLTTHTVEQAAELVSYAQPMADPTFY